MTNKINISSFLLVIISLSLQISIFYSFYYKIYYYYLKIIFLMFIPLTFTISSFTFFYSVNLIYNLITPIGWINNNSLYLAYHKPIITNIDNNIDNNIVSIFNCNDSNDSNDSDYSNDSENEIKNDSSEFYYSIKKTIVTIQIPVYTEDFDKTLKCTFDNMTNLCNQFNMTNSDKQINIFINDDGLLKVDNIERQKRIEYYENNNDIFYIGRPVEGRNGKFKKASNMNFCLRQVLIANYKNENGSFNYSWNKLSKINNFIYKKNNCYDFKIGNFILLFDSDSKIDINSINNLIYEIENDNKIGFLQVKTNAITNTKNNWENIIGYFTDSLYDINFLYSCSNGFPSPLVGHNCMLNFKALIEIEKYINGHANQTNIEWKVWDEEHVSEDFVMSLYMTHLNYYGKYIYYDCGMLEGVTLNIIDEIIKIKKYMYGINEILFYPSNVWLSKGIFSNIFTIFITSNNINFSTRYALICYIGSYYALAIGPIISLLYYFLVIYYKNVYVYININSQLITCIIIFLFLSILTNISIKIRNKKYLNFIILIKQEIYYGLMLTCFFSSLPFHLICSCYDFFSCKNVSWGATNKELSNITCFDFIKKFKYMYFVGMSLFLTITYINFHFYYFYYQNYFIESISIYVYLFMHMGFPLFTF